MKEWVRSFVRTMESPARRARCAAGASAEELASFQTILGLRVPEALLELYGWCNGTARPTFDPATGEFVGERASLLGEGGELELASLDSIVQEKRSWDALADEFERTDDPDFREKNFHYAFWNRAWIPFARTGSSEQWAIATEPCFGGPAGQIVWFDHKGHDCWEVRYASFSQWLLATTALIESEVPEWEAKKVHAIIRPYAGGAGFVELPKPPSADASRFDLALEPYRWFG